MNSNRHEILVRGMKIYTKETGDIVEVISKYRCVFARDVFQPNVDGDLLFKECKKMYSKVLKIGAKEIYTEEEISYINIFFAISTFINYKCPAMICRVKADYGIGSMARKHHPHTILKYNDRITGFNGVIKSMSFTDELSVDDDNITQCRCNMFVNKLNSNEIKQFVEYCQSNTFRSFNLFVLTHN